MKNRTILISVIVMLIIIMISITYNTFPRLQLNGKKNMVISYRDKYQEPGVIIKNANDNYLSKIIIDSNIDDDTIGNYYVDYSLKMGIRQLHVRRNIKVIDEIAPVIKLKGDQIIEISINEEYKEPGYKATDEYDGNLTDRVEVIGVVDNKNYGEYAIKYKVTDNSNNTVEVNRIVKVIDEIAPKIECNAEYSAFKIGSENIIGCKAIDNFDGDITEKIKISGDYDTNKKGIYTVEYSAEDDAGNKTKINHNIIIYEEIENPVAYITFNEETNELAEQVLQLLKENSIKATFFVSQQDNDNYQYLNKIIEEGHELGIYGYYNNQQYKDLSTFKEYFEAMQQLIYNKTGENTKIYRFNGGSNSKYLNNNEFKKIKKYLDERGLTYYDWNIDAEYTTSLAITSKEIEENIINQLFQNKEKEIIISFKVKQDTIDVLHETIKILKEMNYSFDIISNAEKIQFRK